MKDIFKLLGWIWGIVGFIILLKIISVYLPLDKIEEYINVSKKAIIKESRKYSEEKILMDIKERTGFYIKVKNNCSKEGAYFVSETEVVRSKRECKDDTCEITIEFKEDKPSIIEIYKEQKDFSCKGEIYITEEHMKVLGYVIIPELDTLEMEELGITKKDELVLNNGYRLKKEHGKFYYDTLRSSDTLSVKGINKKSVDFILTK